MRALVFLCLVTYVAAYVVNYELDNHEREEEGVPGMAVKGKYSFDGPNGVNYKFYYVADKHGYRVVETDVDGDEISDADESAFKSAVAVGDGVVVGLTDGEGAADAGDGAAGVDEGGEEDGDDDEGDSDDEEGDAKKKSSDDDDDNDGEEGASKKRSSKHIDDDDDDDEAEGDVKKKSIKYSDDDDDDDDAEGGVKKKSIKYSDDDDDDDDKRK